MALGGMAMAAEQTIKVETSIMPSAAPTWVKKGTIEGVTWTKADWGNLFGKGATEEILALTADFKLLGITGVGHYAFNADGGDAETAPTYTAATGAFTITGKSLYANVQSVSDIMNGYDLTALNSLTLTIVGGYSNADGATNSNDTFLAIYKMDSTGNLTNLVDMYAGSGSSLKDTDGNVWTNGTVSYSYNTSGWNLSSTDNIVMFVNHNTATTFTISDMKVTAAVTIPEPATATLSLLALAGLAARRRRATR